MKCGSMVAMYYGHVLAQDGLAVASQWPESVSKWLNNGLRCEPDDSGWYATSLW